MIIKRQKIIKDNEIKQKNKSEKMNVFKIVVSAIAAIAIILIIIQLYQIPNQKAVTQINEILEEAKASINDGKIITITELELEEGTISTKSFNTQFENHIFNCSNFLKCCPKNQECEQKIEWNENQIDIKTKTKIPTYIRCDYDKPEYFCKIYLGNKPGEIKITENLKEEYTFQKNENKKINLSIKNGGEILISKIRMNIEIYEIQQGTEQYYIEQNNSENEINDLNAGEEIEKEITFEINKAGIFKLKIYLIDLDGSKAKIETQIIVTEQKENACKAGEKIRSIIDLETGKCKTEYSCIDCEYAYECEIALEELIGKDIIANSKEKGYYFEENQDLCQ